MIYFYSPSGLRFSFEEMIGQIMNYMTDQSTERYKIIIGTDSAEHSGIDFVSAVVVYHVGHGGRFFWKRIVENKKYTLRQRIYQEALYSLKLAEELVHAFSHYSSCNFNFEIHVDIGNNGPTRELIQEITGMILGSGFQVKTKPESYGASNIADRYA